MASSNKWEKEVFLQNFVSVLFIENVWLENFSLTQSIKTLPCSNYSKCFISLRSLSEGHHSGCFFMPSLFNNWIFKIQLPAKQLLWPEQGCWWRRERSREKQSWLSACTRSGVNRIVHVTRWNWTI